MLIPAARAAPSSSHRLRSSWPITLCQDRLRCLGVRAHDQGLSDRLQPPAGGDPLHLTCGVLAVAARTDEGRIGATVDALQHWVVRPVEEVLHQASDGSQVLRCAEDGAVGCEHVRGLGYRSWEETNPYICFRSRPASSCLRHLLGAAREGVEHDKNGLLHESVSRSGGRSTSSLTSSVSTSWPRTERWRALTGLRASVLNLKFVVERLP